MSAVLKFTEHDLLARYAVAASLEPRVLVDVGAHIGRFSTLFAELGWSGIAFEPDDDNHAKLADNLAPYDGWQAVHAAVAETSGPVTFFLAPEFWGIHSLAATTDDHTVRVEVDGTRLDDAMASAGITDVGILKIDVEGADLPALRSFPLARVRPGVVMCEVMEDRSIEHFGWKTADLVEHLRQAGYACWLAAWGPLERHSRENGGGGPFDFVRCEPYRDGADEPPWGNIIAVPQQDAEAFDAVLWGYLLEITRSVRVHSTALDGLRRTVEARDARIAELDDAIVGRDNRKAELTSAVQQRDARIKELTSVVTQREARVAELEAAIAAKDTNPAGRGLRSHRR